MIKEFNSNNFKDEVKEGMVLVDFYAVWCGPCKMMHPVIEYVCKDNPLLKVLKINVDNFSEIARDYGIMSIPTLILFKDGQIVEKNIGFTSKDILNTWINRNK